ncbi:MAG: LuxR C-terminal-related transcriptional regulator [Anaerolineae bacterium]
MPLTLICTPAGFGKTTLLCTWLESMPGVVDHELIPVAWYSLDENDNDLQVFLRYLVTAIDPIYPDACATTVGLLLAPVHPQEELLATTFLNDLEALPGPLLLIIEDYHSVNAEPVHDLLRKICRHWPSMLRLVLTSRSSPPLPLARLRADGMVTDIRTRDLRFSIDEALSYLGTNLNVPLSDSARLRLCEHTEGWIAGLHLAALSLASADDPENAIELLAGSDTYIAEYLIDEVLGQQTTEIRAFLLATSLLDRFCVELADALFAGQSTLPEIRNAVEQLERANLFITPLDYTHTWYRYHALFRQLLQHRLQVEQSDDTILAMHLRAAKWLATNGYTDEALRHALAARAPEFAADILESGLCEALNREDRATLTRWLDLLPPELVKIRPRLLLLRAWALQFLWQLTTQDSVLRQIEHLLAQNAYPIDDPVYLKQQLAVLNAQAAYLALQPESAAELCLQCIGSIPHEWRYVRGGAAIYLGLGMQASGKSGEAEQILTNLYAESSDKVDGYTMRILIALCFVHLLNGETDRLQQTASVLVERASTTNLPTLSCWGHYFFGVALYLQNEPELAAAHFQIPIEHRFSVQALTGRASYVGLILSHIAQGNTSEALAVLSQLGEYDVTLLGAETGITRSLRTRLQVTSGHTAIAEHWADSQSDLIALQPLLWLEESRLTWARILIALHKPSDVETAIEYLDELLVQAERVHNVLFQVQILVMKAWALSQLPRAQMDEALQTMKRAVILAASRNLMQPFLECGKPVIDLIGHLAQWDGANQFAYRIIDAYARRAHGAERDGPPHTTSFLEPLTMREQDVLLLMRQRLTDKEIAQRLNISVQTAKRHASNIYVKLGVSRRWDAVSVAEAHGILPPR